MKVKRSLQIYSNDLVPKIRGGLDEGLGGIPARIVDQDVDTPASSTAFCTAVKSVMSSLIG